MKKIILGCLIALIWCFSVGLQAQEENMATSVVESEVDQTVTQSAKEKPNSPPMNTELNPQDKATNVTDDAGGVMPVPVPTKETTKSKTVTPDSYYQRDTIDTGSSLVSMVMGLALILGLIAAVAWGMKRFSNMSPAMGKHIKVVSATAVGSRERIALVEVGDKSILIGVTPHNISKLHVFEKDEIPTEAPPSEFARKLQSMLTKGNVKQ